MEYTPVIFASRRTELCRGRSFYVESLEARKLLSVTLNQPISNVTFAQDSGPQTVDFYALFADTNGNVDLKFTATSSTPAVATTSILGNNLTVTPTAGRSGFTVIKMVASDPDGGRSINLFRVLITALPARSLDVTLDGKHRSVQFTQTDHASATLSLSGPGTAVVHFGGDGLKLNGALLNGSHIGMESVTLSNTSGKSHLSITGASSGSGQAMIGNIIVNKSLGSLDIHKALLIGDVQTTGAINSLNFDTAENGTISIGSGVTRMTIGSAVDENFSSGGSISYLQATQWADSDNVPESFIAVALHRMLVKGNFAPAMEMTAVGVKGRALDRVKVRGKITGEWYVPGRVGAIDVGLVPPFWRGTFNSVASLTSQTDFNGEVHADSIGQLNIRGTISFCSIVLTGTGTDLGSMTAGAINSIILLSAGNVGSITAGTLTGSTLMVGFYSLLVGKTLPTAASDFTTTARIKSIRLHPLPKATGFSGSQIAAARIGSLQLGSTNSKNGGVKFGIAAESIDTLSMQDKGRPQIISLRKVKSAAALQSAIAAHKWVLGDLSLSIL